MGGSQASKLLDAEKTTWVKPHKLNYIPHLRREQLPLIEKFGQNLKLCYDEGIICGLEYRHYFVTDGTWVIEFGSGELQSTSINVHCNLKKKYIALWTRHST